MRPKDHQMANTYMLDLRYQPENEGSAIDRLNHLVELLSENGYEVSNSSLFDDGARVSLLISSDQAGRHELKLLKLASDTGSIGRFSCRKAEPQEPHESADAIRVTHV